MMKGVLKFLGVCGVVFLVGWLGYCGIDYQIGSQEIPQYLYFGIGIDAEMDPRVADKVLYILRDDKITWQELGWYQDQRRRLEAKDVKAKVIKQLKGRPSTWIPPSEEELSKYFGPAESQTEL